VIHRRGVLPVLVLLVLVVAGFVVQVVRGPAAASPGSRPTATPTPTATATPTASDEAVLRSLADVERAYDAGNVRRLCRPGVLVDPAVIRAQNARRQGCESELESLIANVPRLQFTVRELGVRADLATATVVAANGNSATIDFVRRDRRWLLSFSDGNDPLPALAGTT
jgi:hypothetical protein